MFLLGILYGFKKKKKIHPQGSLLKKASFKIYGSFLEALLSANVFPQTLWGKQNPFNYTREVRLRKADPSVSNNQDMKKDWKISHSQLIKMLLFFSNLN